MEKAAVDGEDAECVARVEEAGGFGVDRVGDQEQAEGPGEGARIGRIEVDGLWEDEEMFVDADAELVREREEAEGLRSGRFVNVGELRVEIYGF